MTHSLTLGSLLLTDSMPDADHDFVLNVLAEGVGFGVAKGVQQVVLSLLADGDLVRTTRYGNREVSFVVEITGPDLASLAHGEAALRREVGRGNTLTWQPPDEFAVPTVFEVLASDMTQTFDDLDELRRRRKFQVNLTCAPFGRSVDPVAIEPLTAGSTTVTVDSCDSATGWTATRNGAPDVATTFWEAGAVGVAELDSETGFPPETWELTRAGSVDFSSTPYLSTELRVIGSLVVSVSAIVDAGLSTERTLPLLEVRKLGDGSLHHGVTWDASGVGTVSTLTFRHRTTEPTHVWQGLIVRKVSRTDVPPNVTAHQVTRMLENLGTERTAVSIKVEPGLSGTTLGWTIVHTSPEAMGGHSPALRQFRTSGNTVTSDSALMSGGRETVDNTPIVAQVPLTSMPEGEYALVALMRSSVAGSFEIYWQARTLLPGIGYLGGTEGFITAEFATADTWTLVPIDMATLPPIRSNGAFVQLNLQHAPVAAEVIELDEWWSLRMGDDCETTIFFDNAAFLWLDSPDITSGVPRIWVGGDGDRSDAHHPSYNLYAQGNHVLHPGGTSVFVASSGLQYPKVSATYYPRWHSNAAL